MRKLLKAPRWLCAAAIPMMTLTIPAVDFYGLTQSGDRLLYFNQSGGVPSSLTISGLQPGDSLVDIDVFFSGDFRLYGLGTSGTLYTVEPSTGLATVNVLTAAVGSPTAIDFNPAADRLRILSGDANYRLTPNSGVVTSDGTLVYAVGDANQGADPSIVAAAYINNVDNPGTTALYSIDADLDALILHSGGPQFSTLNTVGKLTLGGIDFNIGASTGFDVFSSSVGNNMAFVSSGNDLYSLDLSNGMLNALGTVNTTESLRSIAVASVPEGGAMLPAICASLVGLCYFGRNSGRTAHLLGK